MKHTHDETLTEVRADVWLWAARMYKTRSLAKQAIDGGKVDVNGAGCKPSKALHVGDTVRLTRGEERLELEILVLAELRGPASVAQMLYRETEPSRLAREQARELRRLSGAGLNRPPTRPNKQERRELRRLKDFP
ncbi:RNA-binding S4 domain-containing protein [Dyella nitratireducens]|uniref:Heat shock protein 15 n=1 Tax=Dyella nitratireducens TaxID=1849580 RepID=A0ABQ1GKW9_9GAMM|nr:RNA-binding S4 domain-containing protein [Dyella nitratireducens]GGA45700.1 heat shock protein 15 [Dyella nitratireducens]GLQ41353.1 heat shock protein 15 [Dyella nitratireducens]